MKLTTMLSLNSQLNDLYQRDRSIFIEVFNKAYDHLKNRLALYPKLVKCTFDNGVNLNEPLDLKQYGITALAQIQFKEVVEVVGQTLLAEQPHSELSSGLIETGVNSGYSSGVEIFFSHNYIYADTTETISVPIVGHVYPPCVYLKPRLADVTSFPYVAITESLLSRIDKLYIPDTIIMALTAKMYSLNALEMHNVQMCGAYDALCNDYVNLRNANLITSVPRGMSSLAGVKAYELF